MAQTELLTQDDIEDIGSVVQLSPHVRNSEFAIVEKNTEGEPLVSLDELYEKSGQEAIDKVIKGFNLAVEKTRLSKEHGQLLMVKGSESWLPLPDKLNYVRGAEGFFTALKDGIISIVKAIIKFVKGVWNWIAERVKRLFGFEKTAAEVAYVAEKSETVNQAMAGMVDRLGNAPGKEYDPLEFYNSLPINRTDLEQLQLIKKRQENAKDAIERIAATVPAFGEAVEMLEKIRPNQEKAYRNYTKAIENLRRKYKNRDVSAEDIKVFNQVLRDETFSTLDYTAICNVVGLLMKGFYGIEVPDLGVSGAINKAREQIKSTTEMVMAKLDLNAMVIAKQSHDRLVHDLNTVVVKGKRLREIKFQAKTWEKLPDVMSDVDAEFIQSLADALPSGEAKELPGLYAEYCTRIRDFSLTIDSCLKMIFEVQKTYENIVNWYMKVSALTAAYITRDVKRITEAHKKWLTDAERGKIESADGKPEYLISLEADFEQKYPGLSIPEDVSKLMVQLQEIDKELYGDRIGKFVSQLKG